MPLKLTEVHEMAKIEGTTEFRLVKVHPTASLRREGEPAIFIQDGGIYYESGEEIQSPPAWFWEDVRQMTPERRSQLGLRLPGEPYVSPPGPTGAAKPKRHKSELKPKAPNAGKTCPTCQKTGLRNLPAHVRWAHRAKE